jgi:peptide/nickel transport system ATP-binding protein
LIPGFAIVALVMALNVLGDAARDAFDQVRIPSSQPAPSRTTADAAKVLGSTPLEAEDSAAPSALLEVSGLRVAFGTTEVVSDLSLRLAAGETLGVVGESGSGKSVTARAVFGSLPQATIRARRLHLSDVALLSADARFRGCHIGWVPQDPFGSLHPLQTIGRQLTDCLGLYESGEAAARLGASAKRQAAAQALAEVQIRDPQRVLDSYPHQLSGGMRQRVAIALALIGKPPLVIADEPTTALDVTTQSSVLELLSRATRERAAALLFISHDLAVVRQLCERVLVMKGGVVVERGETTTLLREPRHEYTRRLIDAVPVMSAAPVARSAASDAASVDEVRAPALLEAHDVSRRFELGHFARRRGVQALGGVSFGLCAGDRVGLIGESGSGKSSLVKLLLGLDLPTTGQVRFRGKRCDTLNHEQRRAFRRAVQLVFQDPIASLNPRRCVRDTLEAPLRALTRLDPKARRRRVAELLELVQLPSEMLERFPSELSGGQAQRVAIARALAPEPEVLVLDEAVSSLDVCAQAGILELLRTLSDRLGRAYLFVAHDLAVVDALCTDVLVMFRGRVVERGPVARVLHQPDHPYTRSLLAATPRLFS